MPIPRIIAIKITAGERGLDVELLGAGLLHRRDEHALRHDHNLKHA